MGDHQAHPPDHAGHGHGGGGDEGRTEDDDDADPARVDPHSAGFVVPKGQHVHPPAQQEEGQQADGHGDHGQAHLVPLGSGQAAHEPVGDLGKLVGGIRHQFNEGRARGEKGTHHDARQHQGQHPLAPGHTAHQKGGRHGDDAEAEGGDGDHMAVRPQQNGQRSAEGRPVGGPQDVRRGHGVLKDPLIGGAGRAEAAAHHAAQEDAGQPDVPGHGLHAAVPVHVQSPGCGGGDDAGKEVAQAQQQLVDKHTDQHDRRHRVASQQEGYEDEQHEDYTQDPQGQSAPAKLSHARHTSLSLS